MINSAKEVKPVGLAMTVGQWECSTWLVEKPGSLWQISLASAHNVIKSATRHGVTGLMALLLGTRELLKFMALSG